MNDNTMEKLRQLIDKRKERCKYTGGEIFIVWGCIILASELFQIFIFDSPLVSIAAIIIGIIFQFSYIKFHRIKSGYIIMWKNSINYLWIFVLSIMLIAGWLFPSISKLYSSHASSVLVYFFLSSGFFIHGILLDRWSFKIGGAILILSSIMLALPYPENKAIVSISADFFGIIVPGILSRFEERLYSKE